ncbi:MAG: histidine kinase [Blautia sp.]|nr:histidine kinase [Blautia sp.]
MTIGKALISRGSVYQKIILYFLILSIMTALICAGVYHNGHTVIRKEISEVIREKNKGNANNVYNICQQIRMMLYQFGDTDEILDLIILKQKTDSSDPSREAQITKKIQNIQDDLLMIWKGNTMLQEVTLICPSLDQVITTGSTRPISEEDRMLLAYYEDNETSGNLFSYQGDLMILSEYLLGEYYIYTTLTSYALENGFGQSTWQGSGKSFLYDTRSRESIGSTDTGVQELLSDDEWKEAVGFPQSYQGFLYDVSRISRSDLISVTCYESREIYGVTGLYQAFFLILLAVIVLGAMLFSRSLYALLHRPLHVLMDGLEKVRGGDLDTVITIEREDEFRDIYESFNSMTSRLKQLIEKTYRQEILLKKSELKQLQAQISPHFLYNSFIVLSNRIRAEDYEFASEFSRELGQYFMFLTRNGREFLPLKEELEHAWTYARIQHVRFKNRVTLELDELDSSWEKILVPRLIVQPVFENVFKYVVGNTGDLVALHMGFLYAEDSIRIIIENSGEISDEELATIGDKLGKTDDEIHGMANIHQRLQLIYEGNGGVELGRSSLGGLMVTLKLMKEIPKEES